MKKKIMEKKTTQKTTQKKSSKTCNYISKWFGKILHIWDPIFLQNYYFITTETHKEFCDILKKTWDTYRIVDERAEGKFLVLERKRKGEKGAIDIIGVIWLKKDAGLASLAHECFHATYWTMKDRDTDLDINSEEAFAYMLGFLIKTIKDNGGI